MGKNKYKERKRDRQSEIGICMERERVSER